MTTIIRFYMVPTCALSQIYEMHFRALADRACCDFVAVDIDSDPIAALKYIREYRDRVSKIPFYTVHLARGTPAVLVGNAVTTNLQELEETISKMNK